MPLKSWHDHAIFEQRARRRVIGTGLGTRLERYRDYLELKHELGLSHYQGRNGRAFHHHASLCIAAYGLWTLERLRCSKPYHARIKAPVVPEASLKWGWDHAATSAVLDRDLALSPRLLHRSAPVTMPFYGKEHQKVTRI